MKSKREQHRVYTVAFFHQPFDPLQRPAFDENARALADNWRQAYLQIRFQCAQNLFQLLNEQALRSSTSKYILATAITLKNFSCGSSGREPSNKRRSPGKARLWNTTVFPRYLCGSPVAGQGGGNVLSPGKIEPAFFRSAAAYGRQTKAVHSRAFSLFGFLPSSESSLPFNGFT